MVGRRNAFEVGLEEQQVLVASAPVDNGMLFSVVASLEQSGLRLIGEGKLKTAYFAEAMHAVFGKIADVEIVPPMDKDQAALVAGKVATYAHMQEATAPKPKSRTAKKTDVSRQATDRRKP